MTRSLVADDFEVAVQFMEHRGWRKGSAVGPDGEVCAARALNLAALQRNGNPCDLELARKMLGLEPRWGDTQAAIPRWNDAPSTQFAEVRARFLQAAARMKFREEGLPSHPADDT